jgi:ATP-dependent exoDNAse (exonuclease V) beta subunit
MSGLTVVGASAGSGKTHRLTEEVLGAVTGTSGERVPLEGLVAVTYTRRAHAELESRIRRALLGSGEPERAARMPLAAIGTVHAVCLRWLRELALEAGLSPSVDLLTDERSALREVLEDALGPDEHAELLALAWRFEVGLDMRKGRVDWALPVGQILSLARHGRIAAASLPAMGARATRELLAYLPPPARDAEALDRALRDALDEAVAELESGPDDTKVTRDALATLKACRKRLASPSAPWSAWAKLCNLKIGAKSRATIAPVQAAALAHEHHPRFQAELARLVELAYGAAARTLERYQAWKAERGLVDYVDMIDHALTVLDDPAVRLELADRLRFVVVDELQDSSPVQLALFLKLHALSGRSSWVGDPKQCIFEYAGADPALMDAVLEWADKSDGSVERLEKNWRSLPRLVELNNALFATALAPHGFAREDVCVVAKRTCPAALKKQPALGLFYLESAKNGLDAVALAEGVHRLLDRPEETRVVDPVSGKDRPVVAGDVAVLVATNAEADAIAAALADRGVRATLARTGLLGTPEGTALGAALSYLLDSRDTLALAELEALTGFEADGGPDAWLERKLAEQLARKPDGTRAEAPVTPIAQRLEALRASVAFLSPGEVVDAVLGALDLSTLAVRWPSAPQRLANLEALRRFARLYEERCRHGGEGASLAGLLRFFEELATAEYANGEERAADEQHAGSDPGAVTLMTYHRAKGLEWPVVVLGSLDRAARRSAFGVAPERDTRELDPDAPLAGRWIRYFPAPFGQSKGPLHDRVAASPLGQRVLQTERRERARLLYVGFTRARDHLILTARLKSTAPQTQWLDELVDDEGRAAITLPECDDENPVVRVRKPEGGTLELPVRAWKLSSADVSIESPKTTRAWFTRPQRIVAPDYRVAPSSAAASGLALPSFQEAALAIIHGPVAQTGDRDADRSAIGDAIHAFLAAESDAVGADAERARIATGLLDAYGAPSAYAAADLVAAAEAFRAFVHERAPGAKWHREIPIEARMSGGAAGERAIDGRVDLLLETADGHWIIVDHKSFAGVGEGAWRKKAAEFVPQLAAYAVGLGEVGGGEKKVVEVWIHFAVGGAVWVGRVG